MILRGELVELYPMERKHLPDYVAWFQDPEMVRYFGPIEPLSQEQEERWFESTLSQADVRNYAVYYQGEHVGSAGFARLDFRNRRAEVGLGIGRKDLWDRGLGVDILRVLLRFGFEQLNMHRIYLRVFAENSRAIHCYEKAGFRHEGTLRQCEFRHGRYHDMLLMSVLEDEFWSDVRT